MELEEQAVETVPKEDAFDRAYADAISEHSEAKAEEVEDSGDETEAAAATPDDMEKAAGSGEETAEDSLLSPDEYDSLKDDPVALRKALHKSYTQKTQALAAERRKLQDREYIAELARAHGLLRDEKPEPESKAEPEDPYKELREVLGDELADVLVPSIRNLAVKEAEKVVGPILEAERRRQVEQMESGVRSTLEEFSKRHPGWEKHEREMVALGEKLQKGPQMTNLEYMETLYKLAAPSTAGETAKKVVERMRKAARGADNPDSGVSDNHIAPAPPGLPTLDEAFEAAKKGIRFE
jgi:hypothetical protein